MHQRIKKPRRHEFTDSVDDIFFQELVYLIIEVQVALRKCLSTFAKQELEILFKIFMKLVNPKILFFFISQNIQVQGFFLRT